MEILTDENFFLYAAKVYDSSQCCTTEEFLEDINRIKYIKKLLTRYLETGELKERLILNHLIVLGNVFGAEHLPRILYLKMERQFGSVKPFLLLLGILPSQIINVKKQGIVNTTDILIDRVIDEKLKQI